MESKDKIAISDLVRDLELNVVYRPEGKEFFVQSQDVNRTGLALAGYFEYFAFDRIQIIGKGEYTYFKNIDKDRKGISAISKKGGKAVRDTQWRIFR